MAFVEKRFLFLTITLLSAVNVAFITPMRLTHEGRTLTFSGVVVSEDHHENYVKLYIIIEKALLENNTIDYRIPVEFYTRIKETLLGKRLIIKGRIRPTKFLHQPNILVGKIIETSHAQSPFGRVFYTIRKHIDSSLKSLFDGEHYKIASGLILGGSNRLGKDLKDVFSRAGILHILAVSGLHVGFVCLFISFILFFLPISSKIKFVLVMLVLFMYAGVTGFRPSICRATLMAFLFGLAMIMQRKVDGIHIINITAIFFLLINPLLLFNVGAQLSFAAVYGIVFLYPKITEWLMKRVTNRFFKLICTLMAVSFSAQLFVSSFLIYYFHRLPVLAVFSNLIIVPIATITIFLLFLCLILALFIIPLAKIIAFPVSVLITVLIGVSRFIADIPFSIISLNISPIFLFTFFLLISRRMRKFSIFALLIMAMIVSLVSYSNTVVIKIARDGTLISTASGETIFITLKEKTKLLTMQGLDELDYLIAPCRFYPVRKQFFAVPEKLYRKKIELGKTVIELQKHQKIKYHNVELNISELVPGKDTMLYIITDGKNLYEFKTALYKSIIDQIIVDIKIIFAKFKFLI